MGKKVYTSGLHASDLAEDRPRSGNMDRLAARVAAPVCDDATRAKAAANVRRMCPDGAEEILDALGLQPRKPAKPTARSMACPTCGAAPTGPCQDSNGGVMARCHVARNKALRVALEQADAAEELLNEILVETGDQQ